MPYYVVAISILYLHAIVQSSMFWTR